MEAVTDCMKISCRHLESISLLGQSVKQVNEKWRTMTTELPATAKEE